MALALHLGNDDLELIVDTHGEACKVDGDST